MSITLESAPLPATPGRVVTAAPGATLVDIEPDALFAELREAGFLVLRGFGGTLESYSALVQRSSTRITLDPARVFHGAVAQKVDAGLDAVALHQENATTPFIPDLVWLFCEKAARRGSQTTVCDGVRVWEELSDAARDAFEARDLMFAREVSQQRWKVFAFHQLGGVKPLEEIEFADLDGVLENRDRTLLEPRPDGKIYYEFRTPAVHPTRFGDRPAFCNGMLTEAVYYEPPKITWADGEPIADALKAEVRQVTDRLTGEITWQDRDVLLLDNTRVMHGRRAILDPERTLFNAQSYIDAR